MSFEEEEMKSIKLHALLDEAIAREVVDSLSSATTLNWLFDEIVKLEKITDKKFSKKSKLKSKDHEKWMQRRFDYQYDLFEEVKVKFVEKLKQEIL